MKNSFFYRQEVIIMLIAVSGMFAVGTAVLILKKILPSEDFCTGIESTQPVESTDKPLPAAEAISIPPMYLMRSKSVTQQWREAARPIFQSRGTEDITDRATPEDLKHYLDPCFAVVWQEHGLRDKCTATSVTISSH